MVNLKGKLGNWYVEHSDPHIISVQRGKLPGDGPDTDRAICGIHTNSLTCSELEDSNVHAQLIANAGTTVNKCGLMPHMLLKQRDALLRLIHDHLNIDTGDYLDENGNPQIHALSGDLRVMDRSKNENVGKDKELNISTGAGSKVTIKFS